MDERAARDPPVGASIAGPAPKCPSGIAAAEVVASATIDEVRTACDATDGGEANAILATLDVKRPLIGGL